MKNKFIFFKEMIKNPTQVGSVIPSSNTLATSIINLINFNKSIFIIEYGAGTGVFSDKIIKKLNSSSSLLIIENNIIFFNILKKRYSNYKNVKVLFEGAENIQTILNNHYKDRKVNYVLSGLPFKSFPHSLSHSILLNTSIIMDEECEFLLFQYTKSKINLFQEYFNINFIKKIVLNFPPAYIFSFSKKRIQND